MEKGRSMQKLTDLGVANIKPRLVVKNGKPHGIRFEVSDSVRPGLRMIVQPSSAKSWAVRYRHTGKQYKVTLGTLERLNLADARASEGSAAAGRCR